MYLNPYESSHPVDLPMDQSANLLQGFCNEYIHFTMECGLESQSVHHNKYCVSATKRKGLIIACATD
jgi:hypothetical protein